MPLDEVEFIAEETIIDFGCVCARDASYEVGEVAKTQPDVEDSFAEAWGGCQWV